MSYLDKLDNLIKTGVLGVEYLTLIDVHHDENCPMLKGGHECTCDPDIYVGSRKVG